MLSVQTLKQVEGNGFEKSLIIPSFTQHKFREHCSGLSLVLYTGNAAAKPSDGLSLMELRFQWGRQAGARMDRRLPRVVRKLRDMQGEGWRGK